MILVDSSVWIDYFRGSATPQSNKLDDLLGTEPLAIGDLMVTEVLQGFSREKDFNAARKVLLGLDLVVLGGADVMVEAAKNDRTLRALGSTVRKTTRTLIATRCIVSRHTLLHHDRDFDPFEQHLGLRCAECRT